MSNQAPGGPIRVPRYIRNVLRGFDRFVNAVIFGDDAETISGRLGRLEVRYGGTIPWSRPVSKVVAWALNGIDPNHCQDAVEPEEGDDGVLDRPSGPLPHEDPPPLYRGGNEGEPEEEV
ncbi:MAG: hypothetical protein WC829_02815 [Hyphomicrobium sp.]|jgi:hypothetical protein